MSFVKNKSGFSLLEITIAMGLATGLLLFYMKMQGEQAKKALTAKVNQEIDTFFTDFKATMDRPGFCNKSFESTTMSDKSVTSIQTVKNPRGDIRYKVGDVYGSKTLKLNSITLKDFKPDDKEGFEGIATLELDIEKIGNVYGSKKISKQMEVSVTRDDTKKILACGSLSSGGITIITPTPVTSTPPTLIEHTTPTQLSLPPMDNEQKKAMMIELEKNPDYQKIQESLEEMQNSNGAVESDENL